MPKQPKNEFKALTELGIEKFILTVKTIVQSSILSITWFKLEISIE